MRALAVIPGWRTYVQCEDNSELKMLRKASPRPLHSFRKKNTFIIKTRNEKEYKQYIEKLITNLVAIRNGNITR